MIHRLEGDLFDYQIPSDRLHNDAETRYLDDILALLTERNDAPLIQHRAPADRFVGVCRDFALLLCSFLRRAGIPARLRSGFVDYFGTDGFHVDHMVTALDSARCHQPQTSARQRLNLVTRGSRLWHTAR